jgi:hypothetical protein
LRWAEGSFLRLADLGWIAVNVCFTEIVLKKSVSGREPENHQNILPCMPDFGNAVCLKTICRNDVPTLCGDFGQLEFFNTIRT